MVSSIVLGPVSSSLLVSNSVLSIYIAILIIICMSHNMRPCTDDLVIHKDSSGAENQIRLATY